MSYTVSIYPVQLMHFIQSGGDWEDEKTKSMTFDEGTLAQITKRLAGYGYAPTHERPGARHYEKQFGNLPVGVSVYDTEISFSCPYWEEFSEHVFDIRMDALELADSEDVAFYDPQEGEWNQGLG